MAPTPPIRRTSPTEALLATIDLVEEFEDFGEGRDRQRENPGGHSESNRADGSRRSSAASDFGFERRFSGKRASVQDVEPEAPPPAVKIQVTLASSCPCCWDYQQIVASQKRIIDGQWQIMQNQQRQQLLLMETVSRSVPEATREANAAKEAVAVTRSAPEEAPQPKEATLAKAGTLPGNRFFQPRPDLFENVDILTHSLEALLGGQLCRDLANEEVAFNELLPRVLFIIESKFGNLPPHTEISSFVDRLERAYPFLVEHELYCYNRKHYKKLGMLFQKQSRDNRRYEPAPEEVIEALTGSMGSGSYSNSKKKAA